MFSMDRNPIARVTLCYVPMPGLPSLPYQSPSMVSIPSLTILHTLHWHVCNSYAAQVQDLAITSVGKSPAQCAPLIAMAKIDGVKGRGQIQGGEDYIRCHFNFPKRNSVHTKLGHPNL